MKSIVKNILITNFLIYGSASADNTILIKANSHSIYDNIKHSAYCTQIGGIDITDTMDIRLGINTLDAVFCQIIDDNKYLTALKYASAGILDNDDLISFISKENNTLSNKSYPGVRAEAANSTVPMKQQWWVRCAGYFTNILNSSIHITVNVPDFGCSAQNGNSRFSGNANLTSQVTCTASQGRPTTKNYVNACINGNQCSQATGTIYFR